MSTKHVGTAGDIVRFGCSLKITCAHCGAARTLTGVEVMSIHGSRARLELLERRLICSRCKRKAARMVVLPPVSPPRD